jgi:hypothetical protein
MSIPYKQETLFTKMNPLNTSFKQSSRMLLSYSASIASVRYFSSNY